MRPFAVYSHCTGRPTHRNYKDQSRGSVSGLLARRPVSNLRVGTGEAIATASDVKGGCLSCCHSTTDLLILTVTGQDRKKTTEEQDRRHRGRCGGKHLISYYVPIVRACRRDLTLLNVSHQRSFSLTDLQAFLRDTSAEFRRNVYLETCEGSKETPNPQSDRAWLLRATVG